MQKSGNILGEDKLFGCLSIRCSGDAVYVPKGTHEGTIITHGCGSKGILTGDGRSWSLQPIEENMAEGEVIQVEETPKKKRGRPAGSKNKPKVNGAAEVVAAEPNEDQLLAVAERDSNLLRNVEADCPHEPGSSDFIHWCEKEFDKRKAAVEAHAPEPVRRGRKATAIVKDDTPQFDKEFIAESKQSDKRIDKALTRGGESFFEAIRELVQNGEKGYYKALGFKNFDTYRETKTAYSRSYIADGIRSYKALHGRISDEKLATIPIPTAVLLTKIPESKLTDEIIEAAATMKIQDFKEQKYPEVMSQLVDADGKPQAVEPEDFSWVARMRVHTQVADRWKQFLEVARWKASGYTDGNDVYADFSLDEKVLICIIMECGDSSGWNAEYQEWKTQQAAPGEEPAF